MGLLILADYYEHNLLLKKAKRLRKRNSLILFGWHDQYINGLGRKYSYGYEHGNGCWFLYGVGLGYNYGQGYWNGNGSYYRWDF